MGSTIFRGNKIVTLKDELQVGLDDSDSPSVKKLTVDPQNSNVDANRGSIGMYITTGQIYKKLDDGATTNWEEIGTGGASGINYVENNDFETGATDWIRYDDGASATPVDGLAGSPSVISAPAVTTLAGELLRGTQSLKIEKSAADGQGEGVSVELLNIDPADRDASKRMIISFDYQTTANYVSGDMEVFVYDMDGTALETVTDGSILGTNGDPSKHVCSFNTVAGNDEYRLIFHVTTTNALAYDMIIDNVTVGPDSVVPSSIVTQWQSFTPSINWTNSTPVGRYRRVGDSIQVQADITLTGVPAGGVLDIDWGTPLGLTRDSAKMVKTGATKIVGVASYFDSGSNQYEGKVIDQDTVTVRVTSSRTRNATGVALDAVSTTSGDPITSWGSGDAITVDFMLPVTGWSSGASLSTTENLFKSFNTKVYSSGAVNYGTGLSKVPFNTVAFDRTGGSFDDANDRITVPSDGRYEINYRNTYTGTGTGGLEARIYINGVETTRAAAYETSVNKYSHANEILELSAGDYIEIWVNHADASFDTIGGEAFNSLVVTAIPDFSTFSVWGETELVETVLAADFFDTSPVNAAWEQPNSSFSIALQPGEYDITLQGMFGVNSSTSTVGNQISIEAAFATSSTPGSGLIQIFTSHTGAYATNNFTWQWFTPTLKGYVVTSPTTIYVHLRYRNFSGTPTINTFGFRSDSGSGSGTDPILSARRIK